MLFILVMEAINKMINRVVMGEFLKGFIAAGAGVGTVSVSHLLFAYDTLSFMMQMRPNWIIKAKCSLSYGWCQALKSI